MASRFVTVLLYIILCAPSVSVMLYCCCRRIIITSRVPVSDGFIDVSPQLSNSLEYVLVGTGIQCKVMTWTVTCGGHVYLTEKAVRSDEEVSL